MRSSRSNDGVASGNIGLSTYCLIVDFSISISVIVGVVKLLLLGSIDDILIRIMFILSVISIFIEVAGLLIIHGITDVILGLVLVVILVRGSTGAGGSFTLQLVLLLSSEDVSSCNCLVRAEADFAATLAAIMDPFGRDVGSGLLVLDDKLVLAIEGQALRRRVLLLRVLDIIEPANRAAVENVNILKAVGVDSGEAASPVVLDANLRRDHVAFGKDGLTETLHGLVDGVLGGARLHAVSDLVPRDLDAHLATLVVHVEKELLIHALAYGHEAEEKEEILTTPIEDLASTLALVLGNELEAAREERVLLGVAHPMNGPRGTGDHLGPRLSGTLDRSGGLALSLGGALTSFGLAGGGGRGRALVVGRLLPLGGIVEMLGGNGVNLAALVAWADSRAVGRSRALGGAFGGESGLLGVAASGASIVEYDEKDAATAEYQSTGGESRSEEVMMTSDDVAKEDDDDLLAACNPRGEGDGIVDDVCDDCEPRSEKVMVTGEDVSESVIRER
ncbi:hypothetical protein PGQ11_009273 [Apiospora arundinis]|uniref:Uncharacterized protein n=1 Tax=Apiospora arundinis TaxID=335852 RepID=A0ABR2IIE8_9PEZI